MPSSETVSDLAALLRHAAARAARARADAVMAHGVTAAEWRVLRDLYAGPIAPSVVADRLGLTRGAVSKLVDRLRAKRLVVRAAAGRDDKRFQSLALTGTGARLVAELRDAVDAADAATFATLSQARQATLAEALAMIAPIGE